ncbi:MAG: antitermination protein [Candidatus Pelagibacter sp.]|nr:antitermination protein [Candidatus Pelagibacter sp.]
MVSYKNTPPRVRVIQNLYSIKSNPDTTIRYNKNQFKKFIKDVTEGTLERQELIDEIIKKNLNNDIDIKKTDKILIIIVQAAIYELMYKQNNNINVIISEYLKTAEVFLDKGKIGYLNAILDKISKIVRKR